MELFEDVEDASLFTPGSPLGWKKSAVFVCAKWDRAAVGLYAVVLLLDMFSIDLKWPMLLDNLYKNIQIIRSQSVGKTFL